MKNVKNFIIAFIIFMMDFLFDLYCGVFTLDRPTVAVFWTSLYTVQHTFQSDFAKKGGWRTKLLSIYRSLCYVESRYVFVYLNLTI